VRVFQLTIYNNGIIVDSRAGTDTSKKVLNEGLQWAADVFGLAYREGMVRRWRYVSNLTVTSNVPLLITNPAVSNLCNAAGKQVSEIIGEEIGFSPTRSTKDFERHPKNMPLAGFDIQRRADRPFSEKQVLFGSAIANGRAFPSATAI
jgi:hypothetical protein